MQFTLTINCDNAAFYRESENEGDEPLFDYMGVEIQEQLAKAAAFIGSYGIHTHSTQTLRDSNGSTVGHFELTED